MDAKLLKKIFAEGHLLESAEDRGLMEPLGRQWWFLQDNDPKHKSREVQTWVHNKGIACIDFCPDRGYWVHSDGSIMAPNNSRASFTVLVRSAKSVTP
jgi:hypothetical protein